jgi:uncharacterized membrane protein
MMSSALWMIVTLIALLAIIRRRLKSRVAEALGR